MTKYVYRYKEEIKGESSSSTQSNPSTPSTLKDKQTHLSARITKPTAEQTKRTKSLRVTAPDLYHYMMDELNDRHNIHPYDVQLTAVAGDTGLTIIIRFGEQYAHAREMFFTHEMIQQRHPDLQIFIQDMADECKEIMVADYFKMVKP